MQRATTHLQTLPDQTSANPPLPAQTHTRNRIAFKFHVEHIPGIPGARSLTLASAFLLQRLGREISWEWDYVHTPCNIDAESGREYVLLDVDVDVAVDGGGTMRAKGDDGVEGMGVYCVDLELEIFEVLLVDSEGEGEGEEDTSRLYVLTCIYYLLMSTHLT
ncbi:hypothetical protein K402DRAFT_32564 [Aulographum hederae CBS 113979]|uniref:Uncharacterized protein n=1 Tax=Aulographum hederae CBS 113979 TaxID=1176131 RepID=A0A6G1H5G9_9PEZI|nr:hypothetical protein K402DRAFT_32564 [Aulographum hederae CBS 113979]